MKTNDLWLTKCKYQKLPSENLIQIFWDRKYMINTQYSQIMASFNYYDQKIGPVSTNLLDELSYLSKILIVMHSQET